jgi:hypothetical protein
MIIFGTLSSVSAKGFFSNSCKVSFDKTLEQVHYFERIFNTRNKDVKMRMYMAMQDRG